jgi:hypothetical protein
LSLVFRLTLASARFFRQDKLRVRRTLYQIRQVV